MWHPLNYFPRYCRMLAYYWNQILNLQLGPIQIWKFLRRPGWISRNCWTRSTPDNLPKCDTTNLIELDIPTEGPPVASKSYTVPLKYCKFVDHEIKQLEEEGIILYSMSIWVTPILVVPQKQDRVDMGNPQGSNNGKFNLWLCINYRKLNSHIQTASQIKADDSLGKVISNYPQPMFNSILVHFNGCKYFPTIDLTFGCYIELYMHLSLPNQSDWLLPASISSCLLLLIAIARQETKATI